MRILIAVLAVATVGPWASATTYFVRNANGKDSNNGLSPSTPFKTITKAISLAQPGDVIYVAPGTYTASVATVRAGTATGPIRVVGDVSGAQFGVKAGNVVVKPGTSNTGFLLQHNYHRLENIRITKARNAVIVQNCTGCAMLNMDLNNSQADGLQVVNASATFDVGKIRSSKDDGVELGVNASLTMTGTLIYSSKDRGVTLTAATSSATLREVQVYSNTAHGVEAVLGNLTLINALVRNNGQDGVRAGGGGGLGPSVSVWHATIARNAGDGVEIEGGTFTTTNSIIAYNSGVGLRRTGGTFNHTYNIIFSNTAGAFVGTVLSAGESTVDPKFTSTSVYTLQSGSPAVNAGDSSLSVTSIDLVGATRPQGGGWDLGAYEGTATPIFTDVTSTAGFGFTTSTNEDDGSGMSWVDLDDDGDLDCIVTGSTARVITNNGAGASFSAYTLGAFRGQGAVLDANNDACPDFWASSSPTGSSGQLFLNTAGVLTAADSAGMTGPTNADGACAIDVNADGWLDLLMFGTNGNWVGMNVKSSSSPAFTPSKPAGLNASNGNGDFCSTGDVNDDGLLDVLYHYSGGKLYLLSSSGTFALAPATTGGGADISFSTSPSKKIASAWADYDNDGDVDLVVTDRANNSSGSMFENNDDGTFDEVSDEAGLVAASNGQRGCAWGDYDNDGHLDLYVATRTGGCQLYRNLGGGTFVLTGLGADVNIDAQDAVFVDYDNDGDLDIAITRVGGGMMLLRNNTNTTRYLKVRVLGAGNGGTNTLGIGTRVELYTSGGQFVARRDIGVARGYAGTEPLWAHFGGVTPGASYTLKVYFKSGVVTQSVTPATASTTIGARTIAQMVTLQEPPVGPSVRLVRWREVSGEE
ncbi:MAG: hypothetical protein HBSAPP03_08180 [Phycisphaerae bacterium]|nr:MAG: hypothetical protein HBSAPP03_08180 [Phycisphaerae bacterium]